MVLLWGVMWINKFVFLCIVVPDGFGYSTALVFERERKVNI